MLQQKPASEGHFDAGWRSRVQRRYGQRAAPQLACWAYNNLTSQLPLFRERCFRTPKLVPAISPACAAQLSTAPAASAAAPTSAATAATTVAATAAAHCPGGGIDRRIRRIRQD